MTTSLKKVVIVDYKMGNVASVKKAFEKLGARVKISSTKNDIGSAQYIVLPGVGAFGEGISNLKKLGLIDILSKSVLKKRVPFLGICIGMQLLADTGYEFGKHDGLGWIKGETIKLKSTNLPHIGWNNIKTKSNKLFSDLPDNNFYFVHSYFLKPADKSIVTSTCNYDQVFSSSIQKDNIFATQFHPEKSQLAGLKVLDNFLSYTHAKN
ncbi:MAG: imidazole glycerol phosphate synthase, glutamine amidotransferase subunit [Candidatus Yanofskybacteria bacterium RIFCSPHIGHO2_02_FULL_38_22b]|uniref:Imidazole glycerol phosphate synthase subunit HisH n=1 Tax=Candidatus Yanofskybacteria bacterium RIFCSPHIGHO2_02_FULL_38_22b TaxID=1802673 RepID=A0A1F8F664_9BACT|nr:MAG: imidazole glycerol phosphate synthase, glutamine amidotransferase subunit [Candidatus Yanofskybacteria bacterium RIFCSPHIGHO2_01_FULL_39_44]OGN07769.1 MAG: imidazole glycerol phosphate synthase, glutamine amidotransferase subunit [Candidatus Yanofskybacteria bacterium RIFCSPHIGHO2_02_FULL_38_22b]OGN20651.1 MAG: imidazole glycerol phosphate synthase, glutamine amidotransferase subunit [Candidatus Yanofskybacteria bacterium RIFCSPLOWO2_01_FULL_39_28]